MKNTLLAVVSLLLTGAALGGPLLTKTPPAQPMLPPSPSSGGWYAGISGGYLWLNDTTACGCANLNYDYGWGVHGALGYSFANGLSLGLSGGYLEGHYDVTGSDGTGSADLQMVPVMANATYNINLTNSLLLYVGGGLGTAWTEIEGTEDAASSGDWHFAWQGRAGFGYKVSNDLTLNLGYRYLSVDDAMSAYGDARGHMAEAGFKVKF